MRSPALFWFIVASVACGQSLALTSGSLGLDACAQGCISTNASGASSIDDVNYFCGNVALREAVSGCAYNCSVKTGFAVENATKSLCGVEVKNRQNELYGTTIAFGALALIAVSVRLANRLPSLGGGFGMDDCLIVAAMVMAAGEAVILILMTNAGYGTEIYATPPDDIYIILKFYYSLTIVYTFVIILTKLSLLAFYRRIFTSPRFTMINHAVMAFSVCVMVAFLPPAIFQCRPISYAWKSWNGEHQGSCLNFMAGAFAFAGVNTLLDIVIILMPIPLLIRLKLRPKRKIQLLGLFSVGFFITVVSIVRLESLRRFRPYGGDPIRDTVSTSVWSTIENDVAITCACLPGIRQLLSRVFPSWFGSTVEESQVYDANGRTPVPGTVRKTATTTISRVHRFGDSVEELFSLEMGSLGPSSEAMYEVDARSSLSGREKQGTSKKHELGT